MPSYVVTGASRGLGWEFLRQLSSNEDNKVIGIVRDKEPTDKKVAEELGARSNITILQGDLTDYDSLKAAASATSEITGGSLDHLIANAAYVPTYDAYDGIGDLAEDPKELETHMRLFNETNVIGNVHLYKLFLPLILKGQAKKVIHITSPHADLDPINQYEVEQSALYAISKAGANIAIAKFNAQYKKDGVLFMSISPGVVEVGHFSRATPEQQQKAGELLAKFKAYAPHFTGLATPEDAIRDVLATIHRATIEDGFGGAFLSHNGDKQWL
jgi:NAD(P)-dependent dehydrogenase (short-subunit alcohol dehydrogenase family)